MKNILYINAGAGSGKTYRLTHELPKYLCEKDPAKRISPSEVIVTTFTVAAADEIKERARKVLLEQGRTDEAAQLDTAAIGTIHSVCQQFIRKYWYAIGMAPETDVLSTVDKQMYRNQSIAALLDSGDFTKERQAIDAYYKEFRPKHDVNGYKVDYPEFWTEMLDKMVGRLAYYDINDEGIKESIRASKEEVHQLFTSDSLPDPQCFKELYHQAISLISTYVENKTAGAATDEKELAKLKKVQDTLTYSNLQSLQDISKFTKKIPDLENICNTFDSWMTSRYYGNIVENLIDSLFTLALAWKQRYELYKKAHRVIDYDDMERGMLALLQDDDICEEIGHDYKLVMVDEFQDCNPIQLRIFNLFSDAVAKNSPFAQSTIWVGDPKQAIYAFRGSNTDLINRVAKKFPKEKLVTDEKGLMRDELDVSYRSRKPLVELANKAFHRDGLFPDMVELKHSQEKNPELSKYTNAVHHLHFLDSTNEEYYLNLARYIREMVESKKYMVRPKDTDIVRPLEYGDIALLVRSNNDASGIAHEMMCTEIPVYVPEKDIWDRAEVQLVMSLLRLTERQKTSVQAHEIASLLRLWCNTETEDILSDRIKFYSKAEPNEKGFIDDTWKKECTELQPLFLAIEAVREKPLDQKITDLILLLSLNDKVAKWGQAKLRRSNLCTLQRTAAAFCQRCDNLGIDKNSVQFGIYLQESELDVAKDDVKDAVKVLTYHGSKGLEWPMVMLLSMDKHYTGDNDVRKDLLDVKEQVYKEKSNEIIPDYRLHVLPNFMGASLPSCFVDKLKSLPRFEETRNASKQDATRLLYVGMTRAREYLFTVNNGKEVKLDLFNAIGIVPNGDDIWNTGIEVETEDINAILPPKPGKPRGKNPNMEEYERKMAEYEALVGPIANRHDIPLGKYTQPNIQPLSDDGYIAQKINPSKIEYTGTEATFTKYDIPGVHFFPGSLPSGKTDAHLGTCIHNAFAAYNPYATEAQTLATFQTVITNHGFTGALEPDKLHKSISALYQWLTEQYGKGIVCHEVPFRHYRKDGTHVSGEMDLLWKTDKGTVLIDFKNFIAADPSTVLKPLDKDGNDNKHYVGHYVPQLTAYREALTSSGETVLATLIYYSTLGVIIEIK